MSKKYIELSCKCFFCVCILISHILGQWFELTTELKASRSFSSIFETDDNGIVLLGGTSETGENSSEIIRNGESEFLPFTLEPPSK